jgi:4a-hydroxytetrahydrobiopterin dehydratase
MSLVEAQQMMGQIDSAWQLIRDDIPAITRKYTLHDFDEAMNFVNKVAQIAREQDHHPDLSISYNKVAVTLTTHKISGLSENDFIVAAQIDEL